MKSGRNSNGKTSPFKVAPDTKQDAAEDIYNAATIEFPTVDGEDEFDQTITPMMLHKKGMIAPSKIQDSIVMIKNDKVVPSELVIEKMLMFNHQDDEDIEVWNMLDNDFEEGQDDRVSYAKMMNEMLHREARYIDDKGQNRLYSVWGAKLGRHSTNQKARQSDLTQLGPGILLYFRMLKFFQCMLFAFVLISIPTIMIFANGKGYENSEV